MSLVRESIAFKRGQDSKKSMNVGWNSLIKTFDQKDALAYVEDMAKDLQLSTGVDVKVEGDMYAPGWNIEIPELEKQDLIISFLPYRERHWNDSGNEDWGWAIWNRDDGEMGIEAGSDFVVIIEKVREILKA